jgi:tetratricopeptide (TPR) repeat protein
MNAFDQILLEYPNDRVLKDALAIVRNILLEERGPDYLTSLSEEHNILDINKAELDEEVFLSAADHYFNQDCSKAIDVLGAYLNQFRPAIHATEANYYIAECYFATGEVDKALEAYNFVITQPVNELTEDALVAAATIHFNQKNYEVALNNYRELEGVALNKNNVLEAEIGQMRCYWKLNQNQYALDYANRVINNEGTPANIKDDALLMRARILMSNEQYDDAYYDFAEIAKKTGVRAAEAKYNMALIAYKKEAYKPAEKECFELIQKFSAFSEFKYKGFLLLADVYMKLEDYFQARTTLNTILDNVSEPWVIDEARAKMEELERLENPPEENQEKSEIEINLNPEGSEDGSDEFEKLEEIEEEKSNTPNESPDNDK